MDPLSAFALAAGIIQLTDFALKTVCICRKIQKEGQSNPELAEAVTDFYRASDNLQSSISSANKESPVSEDDQTLLDLASRCCQTAEALKSELERLRVCEKGGRMIQLLISVLESSGIHPSSKILKISWNFTERLWTRLFLSTWGKLFSKDWEVAMYQVGRRYYIWVYTLNARAITLYNQH